jgi:hypothetical protein
MYKILHFKKLQLQYKKLLQMPKTQVKLFRRMQHKIQITETIHHVFYNPVIPSILVLNITQIIYHKK